VNIRGIETPITAASSASKNPTGLEKSRNSKKLKGI